MLGSGLGPAISRRFRATDPATKAFLQELASEYESIAGEAVDVDPDDAELQHAFADRLVSLAAKRKGWDAIESARRPERGFGGALNGLNDRRR